MPRENSSPDRRQVPRDDARELEEGRRRDRAPDGVERGGQDAVPRVQDPQGTHARARRRRGKGCDGAVLTSFRACSRTSGPRPSRSSERRRYRIVGRK